MVRVERDVALANVGAAFTDEAKVEVEAERVKAICEAAPITPEEYVELARIQRTQMISRQDRNSMRHHEITSFYREPISAELVSEDDNGTYRHKVRLAQVFFTPDELLIERELERANDEVLPTDFKNLALKKGLLRELLMSAGVADENDTIKTDVEVTKLTLGSFAETYRSRRKCIEELFGLSVRGDLENKAVTTLNQVLALIGLRADAVAVKLVVA